MRSLIASLLLLGIHGTATSAPGQPAAPPAQPESGRTSGPVRGPAAAWVRPGPEPGQAVGRNLRSGSTFAGDVIAVLQSLADELAPANGGPGGSIVIRNGLYVTDRLKPLELRNGVHILAATRRGARLKLAAGVAEEHPGPFFSGRDIEDVVIDGIVFDGNRDAQNVTIPLTRDARAGDTALHVSEEHAARLGAQRRRIGIGRKHGGFQVRSRNHQQRAAAESVDATDGVVHLKAPLKHDYPLADGGEIVFYPAVTGVGLSGANFAIRNCTCVNTQEGVALFATGREKSHGTKVLEYNAVTGHRGDACIRLQRGTYGGVARGNYVEDFQAWYQRFWAEGVAAEGNWHSIVEGNIIRGPGDRLIRANDTHHCVIANNILWTPLLEVQSCNALAGFQPLRGDESIALGGKTRGPVVVAGGKADRPGVIVGNLGEAGGDWSRCNRLYVWAMLQRSEVPLRLTLVDAAGHTATFGTITWVGGEWQWACFDLTAPLDGSEDPPPLNLLAGPDASASPAAPTVPGVSPVTEPAVSDPDEAELDFSKIVRIAIACDTPHDGFTFRLGKIELGQRTGWGVTVWGADGTTVANNTFYGVGSRRGTIYYGSGGWSTSRHLTISGNTLSFCYDGIGWDRSKATRITVSGNTLYATMGGIRGDISAVGNVISYDGGNAATDYSLHATIASGNRLYKTLGISVTGPGVANVRGNTLEDFAGPGIVSRENDGALIADNVLRTRLSRDGPAILLEETASANRVSDNWIDGADGALDIRGSRSVIKGNFVRGTAGNAIRAAGTDNIVRDNDVLPAAATQPADTNSDE